MKLRSKHEYIGEEKPKGRVGTLIGYSDSHKAIVVEFEGEDGGIITSLYRSLAELNEEWEDYEPKEPLIKDKKIRKAVRAWAEANDIHRVAYHKCSHYWYLRSFNDNEQAIDFWLSYNAELEMNEDEFYTIAELCGEEE